MFVCVYLCVSVGLPAYVFNSMLGWLCVCMIVCVCACLCVCLVYSYLCMFGLLVCVRL